MSTSNTTALRWRKASRSGTENGGCVEVADSMDGIVRIRDSTRPGAGTHVVPSSAFAAFLADAKAGVYDLQGS